MAAPAIRLISGASAKAAPGSFIAFSEVSYQDAVTAMAPVNDYLAKLRATADLYRVL